MPSTEHNELENTVRRIANDLYITQAHLEQAIKRIEAIEDALQTRLEADRAHQLTPANAKGKSRAHNLPR